MNARIALPSKSPFSPARLAADVRSAISGQVAVSSVQKSEKGHTTFEVGNSRVVIRGSGKPIHWNDVRQVFNDSRHWSPDQSAVLTHQANIGIGISGTDSPAVQAKVLTLVVAQALSQFPNAVGVYWAAACHFVPTHVFRVLVADPENVSRCWVSIQLGHSNEGRSEGWTRGLQSLGLREIETRNAAESGAELKGRLFGLIDFLIENGDVLSDGESFGETDSEQILIRLADQSSVGIVGPVMHLDYSPSNAVDRGATFHDRKSHQPGPAYRSDRKASRWPWYVAAVFAAGLAFLAGWIIFSGNGPGESLAGFKPDNSGPHDSSSRADKENAKSGAEQRQSDQIVSDPTIENPPRGNGPIEDKPENVPSNMEKRPKNQIASEPSGEDSVQGSGNVPPVSDAAWTDHTATGDKTSVVNSVIATIPQFQRAVDVVFSSNGKRIYAVCPDEILVAEIGTDTQPDNYSRPEGSSTRRMQALAISPYDNYLLVGDDNGTVETWEIDELGELRLLSAFRGHNAAISSLAISPDGKLVVSGDAQGQAILWDHELHDSIMNFQLPDAVLDTRFSPDGNKVCAIGKSRFCQVVLETMTVLISDFEFQDYQSGYNDLAMALSPAGDIVAMLVGREIYFLNPAHGFSIMSQRKLGYLGGSFCFVADGTYVLHAADDLEKWFVAGDQPVKAMSIDITSRGKVNKVFVNRQGTLIAAITDDSLVIVRNDVEQIDRQARFEISKEAVGVAE